jgi:cold shock CspA family protein
MHEGTIKAVLTARGFGFIRRSDGEPDIFFHCRNLASGMEFDGLLMERRVRFDIVPGRSGKLAAVNVSPAD